MYCKYFFQFSLALRIRILTFLDGSGSERPDSGFDPVLRDFYKLYTKQRKYFFSLSKIGLQYFFVKLNFVVVETSNFILFSPDWDV